MSKNDSGSNTKKKISFDINNVEKPVNKVNSSSVKAPVFSIKNDRTESAAPAEAGLKVSASQAPASEQPVFEIHNDTEPQKSNDASVVTTSGSLANAEVAPRITIQSKIPDSPADSVSGSQTVSLTSSNAEMSLTQSTQDSLSVTSQTSTSLTAKEAQPSTINSASTETSLDSLMSLNQELEELQRKLDANSLAIASNNSEIAAVTEKQSLSLTREAYRDSVSVTQSERESIETFQPGESRSKSGHVSRPRPPRPQKTSEERVEPLFVTPEKEQTKEKQPKVEWNGPQVPTRKEAESFRIETATSSATRSATSHSRSARRENRQPQKKSGILGKSFLAMLGFGRKDD